MRQRVEPREGDAVQERAGGEQPPRRAPEARPRQRDAGDRRQPGEQVQGRGELEYFDHQLRVASARTRKGPATRASRALAQALHLLGDVGGVLHRLEDAVARLAERARSGSPRASLAREMAARLLEQDLGAALERERRAPTGSRAPAAATLRQPRTPRGVARRPAWITTRAATPRRSPTRPMRSAGGAALIGVGRDAGAEHEPVAAFTIATAHRE